MSILIKGMEMPKTGVYILSVDNTGKDKTIFTITEHTSSGKIILRHVGEAVPVPPHGDLIDRDALLQRAIPHGWSTPLWVSDIAIEDAPTIIPAEEE